MTRILAAVAAGALIVPGAWASCDGAGASFEAAGSDGTAWRLVWSDEFDGEAIDPTKWAHEVDCWGGGNAERQCYTAFPQNSRVEEGCLLIEAHLEEMTGPALPERFLTNATEEERNATNTLPFTSARLVTRDLADWRYGRIEVRARLPEGQGTWPAIWMLPSDEVYGGWAASGEIDIMEAVNLGEPCDECEGGIENRMFGTLHFGDLWPRNTYKNRETTLPSTDGEGQDFHVFAAEWSEGRIEWFLDGVSYGYLTEEDWHSATEAGQASTYAPFDQDFYLILNLAIGGHLPEDRNTGGVDYEGYPRSMDVDWVRVFDCPVDPERAVACRTGDPAE